MREFEIKVAAIIWKEIANTMHIIILKSTHDLRKMYVLKSVNIKNSVSFYFVQRNITVNV